MLIPREYIVLAAAALTLLIGFMTQEPVVRQTTAGRVAMVAVGLGLAVLLLMLVGDVMV